MWNYFCQHVVNPVSQWHLQRKVQWATVHMTSDTTGLVNNKMAPERHTITLGNGQEETDTRIIDIKGKVLNHENKAWEIVILQKV
jgi:hypothetical protein